MVVLKLNYMYLIAVGSRLQLISGCVWPQVLVDLKVRPVGHDFYRFLEFVVRQAVWSWTGG